MNIVTANNVASLFKIPGIRSTEMLVAVTVDLPALIHDFFASVKGFRDYL